MITENKDQSLVPSEGFPVTTQGQELPQLEFDFGGAFLSGHGAKDIKDFTDAVDAPAVLYSPDYYKQQFPDIDPRKIDLVFPEIEKSFRDYNLGEYHQKNSIFDEASTLRYNTAFQRYGFETLPFDYPEPKPISHNVYYGPGKYQQGFEFRTPDQVARGIPYMFDKDNNLIENKWLNRAGRNISVIEYTDPTSNLGFMYKEFPWSERLIADNVRSVYGVKKMDTPIMGKIFPWKGFASNLIGLNLNVAGSLSKIIGDLGQMAFNPEAYENYQDNVVTRFGNSLSNLGAAYSHMNQDQQMGPFENASSFMYNVYSMFGQITGMAALSASIGRAGYVAAAPYWSIGLGAGQMGSMVYRTALENGATPMQAMSIFFSYGAMTYLANMAISANILQTSVAKRAAMLNKKAVQKIGEQWYGGAGAAIPTQSAEKAADIAGKSFFKNWTSPAAAWRETGKRATALAERNAFMRGVISGVEEGTEEFLEELLQYPLSVLYNKHLFVPQARSIVREHELNQYEYFVEEGADGLPSYYKRPKNGTKIPITYNVWKGEQEDLATARNVLAGKYPMDEDITLEEAGIAAISSFFSGVGLHYISGAHKAKRFNDIEMLQERLAIDIAKLSPNKQRRALEQIRETLRQEQKQSNVFGPNNLTPDGRVVNPDQGGVAAADIAIDTFVNDIQLNLELIRFSGITDPIRLSAMKNNNYLMIEAIKEIKAIRAIENAIQQKEAGQQVEGYDGLFDNTTSIEVLNQRLQAKQEAFKNIVTPKDGPNGKETSQRYTELFMEHKAVDEMIKRSAERKATDYLKGVYRDENYTPDKNSEEFIRIKDRYVSQIRSNPNEVIWLAWAKDPVKAFASYNWEGNLAPEVYSFLNYIYKKLIGAEMTALAQEINQKVKAAREFTADPAKLSDLRNKIKQLGQIDLLIARDQKMTPDQIKNITAELASVQDVLQEFLAVEDLTQYSQELTKTSEQYTQLYNDLLGELDRFEETALRLSETSRAREMNLEEGETATEIYDFNPSKDTVVHAQAFSNLVNQFKENLQKREAARQEFNQRIGSDFRHTREIGEISNESPEVQADLRQRAIERFINQTNVTAAKIPNSISIDEMLAFYKDLLEGDQPLTNQAQIVDNLMVWKKNIQLMRDAVDLNVGFIQELAGEEAQHSMLRGKENSHLLFNAKERDHILKRSDGLIKEIDSILESEKLSVFSREYAQFKEMVRHIEVRNFHLSEIAEFFTANGTLNTVNSDFRDAYNEIGRELDKHGQNGALQFRIWIEQFFDGSAEKSADKNKILEAIYKVDAAISKAEDLLGGRLEGFIREKVNEMHQSEYDIQNIEDFVKEPPSNRAAQKIEGVFNAERFKNYASETSVSHAYFWSVLTWANNLNRLGITKNGKKIPKRSDIAKAYRDVLRSRLTTKEEKVANKIPEKAKINVATYEQEQILFHVLGFILNPQQAYLKAPFEEVIKQIKWSLYVRGYAGSGKTTQLLIDLYETLDKINGKSTPVTIVVPTEKLMKTHIENFRVIGKKDYKIVYLHEVLNKTAELDDIVIFDEVSILGSDKLADLANYIGRRRSIWIGDDAQTPDIRYMSIHLPIKNYAIERTYPMTEVFRSGNPDHFALQDYFRAMTMGAISDVLPKVTYSYEVGGTIIGSRYYQGKEQLRDEFITQWERMPEEYRTPENLAYIAVSVVELNDFMEFISNKFSGNSVAIENIRKLAFTVLYDPKNPNLSVGGLSSRKVFFEFDPEAFTQKTASDAGLGNIKMINALPSVLSNTGRVGYTGSSRQTEFIGLIGDPNSSTEGKVSSVITQLASAEKEVLREVSIRRLNATFGSDSEYASKKETSKTDPKKADESKKKPVQEKQTVSDEAETEAERPVGTPEFDRSFQLTEESRSAIQKSAELQNMRKQLHQSNPKKLSKFEKEGKTIYHATDIAFEAVKETVKKQEQQFEANAQISRARSAVFSQILRYHFDRSESTYQTVLARIRDLNNVYRTLNENHPNIIKDERGFFMSIYKTIASDLNFNVGDPLNIVSPLLVKDDATVVVDGVEQKAVLQASPALMKVVGFDKHGNPIVDLLEFVIHDNYGSVSRQPGPYTKAKLAMYAAMADQGSYFENRKPKKIKINRVFVSNYVDTVGALEYQGSYVVSDGDMIEYLKDIQKYFLDIEKSGMEMEEIFVDKNGFYANERVIEHPSVPTKISYYKGEGLKREKVLVTRVTQKIAKNGKVLNKVYFRTTEMVEKSMPLQKFLSTYRSASTKEALSENELFNHRADVFINTGAVMSHALVFSPTEMDSGGNFNDLVTRPSFRARMKFLGKMDMDMPLIKRYHSEMDLVKYDNETGKYYRRSFKHVVTNEVTDEYLNANEDLVRSTLKDAEIAAAGAKDFSDALKAFKDNRFHIISFENDPEAGFGSSNSLTTNFEAADVMAEFLRSGYGTPEFQTAFEQLENSILNGFPQQDQHYGALVDYNIYKLLSMKVLYELSKSGDGAIAYIGRIEPGNLKRSNFARPATEFIEEAKQRGFTASEPEIHENEHGRKFFIIKFSREGIPGSVNVAFDAKPATVEYIDALEKKLSEFSKNSQALKDYEARLNNLLSKDPNETTNEDLELLNATAHEGFMLLEAEPAFQFIAANLALIKNIQGYIEQRIRNKKNKADSTDFRFTGFLLDYDPKGVSIKGRTVSEKVRNLRAALIEIRDMIVNDVKINGESVTFRVDPFFVPDTETSEQATEIGILVDMLETKTELIKNPEIYTFSDELKRMIDENSPRTVYYEGEAEVNTTPEADENIVEPETEKGAQEPSKRPWDQDYDDDTYDFSISTQQAYNLDKSNSETVEAALAEVRRIIGDAGKKYGIELKTFDLNGQNGVVLYGQLSGRLMRLWGKEIDGQFSVLENVGRHEAMHFVMKYLLDRGSYNKIMNEVAKSLGIEYNAQNELIIHEAIADSFMTMDSIKKPETLWQKFIQALKEIANWFGFYSFSYNEMMVAADKGFFAGVNFNPEGNSFIETFNKKRFVSKWAEPDAIQHAIEKVGNRDLYEIVKNTYLLPRFKNNLVIGKSMTYVNNDPATALYFTMSNIQSYDKNYKIGELTHIINGREVKVADFTPEDFAYVIRNKMRAARSDYSAYILSKREVILPMFQEMFPNVNVEGMYRAGRRAKKEDNGNSGLPTNLTGEVAAHSAETKSFSDSITDLQELIFSTVKYRVYKSDVHGFTSRNASKMRFVSPAMVKKVFLDTMQEIKETGLAYYVDRDTFFNTMRKRLERTGLDTYTRNAIWSVLLEFGDEYLATRPDKNTGYTEKYIIQNGNLEEVGYLHILNNLEKFDKLSKQGNNPFTLRKQAYEDLLSGILKTFAGTTIDRVGIADFKSQRLNIRTNSAEAIERSVIEEIVRDKLFDELGFVNNKVGSLLKGIKNGGSFDVTSFGFKYKSPVSESSRIAEFNMISNISDITAAEMSAIFNALGIYAFPSGVFASLIASEKRNQSNKFFSIVHRMLVTAKVNYALSNAILQEVESLNQLNEKKQSIPEDTDVFKNAINRLSKQDKALFEYMLDKIYNAVYDPVNAQFSFGDYTFKTTVNAHYNVGDNTISQEFEIPSPLDIYRDFEALASLMTDVSAITPPTINFTPNGNISHSLRKEMPADELLFGSKNHMQRIRGELDLSGGRSPLIQLTPEGKKYNNPILNNKIAYLDAYYVSGVTNQPKGRDYSDLVKHDFYVMMIETLLASEIRKRFGSPRYDIVMTPLAEQGKALVVPFYFPVRGGSQRFFMMNYEGGKLKSININKKLVVDIVDDLVDYYEARQMKSLELIKEVMGESSIEAVRNKAISGEEIVVAPENVRKVRQELQVGRDYVLVRENKVAPYSIVIKYGGAASMNGIVFNHEFRNTWRSIKQEAKVAGTSDVETAFRLYDLIKTSVAGDFRLFAKDLNDTKAYEYFLREGSKIPKQFFSDFDSDFMKSLTVFGDQINALNSEWLSKDADVQARFPNVKSVDDLYRVAGLEANQIYKRMKQDKAHQKKIRALKNRSAKQVETDHLNAIRAAAGLEVVQLTKGKKEGDMLMREYKWPPMIEGIFMLHWLVNESLGMLVRDDPTNYADIPEMIKRGHGYKAPGNPFDTGNSGGLGAELNVAIMEDVPGYNEMLGVNPGDRAGRKIWTDGNVIVNPITQVHMKRSHGGLFGNINDNVNKTVLFGRDYRFDQTYYFKMAMAPIIEEMYLSSAFYRNTFNAMLGEFLPQFEAFYNQSGSFQFAVQEMANWVNNPDNAVTETDPITGETRQVLPRDKMVHFLVHESAFKSGTTGINGYIYSEENPKFWSADNIVAPDIQVTMKVPTQFLRLQNINNSNGDADLHSFATQLFSVVGVYKHNAPYYNAIQNALAEKTKQISQEIAEVISQYEKDGNIENVRKYFYNKVRSISGRSIRNTRFEELLNSDADPNTMRKKLNETFTSYLNEHLKPRVPGHNAPQQPLLMNGYRSQKDGSFYLANDIGLDNDAEIADGYNRSLLRPLSFYTRDGNAFTSHDALRSFLEGGPDASSEVVVAPAEVIMKFPYLNQFGLDPKSSLASVMSVTTPDGVASLYETGFQRAAGLGAINGKALGMKILELTQATTVQELLDSFVDDAVRQRFQRHLRNRALKHAEQKGMLGSKKENNRLTKEMAEPIIAAEYESILRESIIVEGQKGQDLHSFVEFVGIYFFNLNNALDILTVRIPTSGPASASAGRIVAFSNTAGNTIFTSAEKSILDGSDYDYDELHVFYHKMRGLTIERGDYENVILDNMLNYYKDVRNHEILLTPIDLQTLRDRVEQFDENVIEPKIPHSISSHVHNQDAIYAGENLVGHFANQMRFTNNLMALSDKVKAQGLSPELVNMFARPIMERGRVVGEENNYLQVIDFINKLVNAATDNANEGGLLGKLNIKAPVTNLMLGMIASKQIVPGVTIESLVLDELNNPVLKEAVKRVQSLQKMTYLGAGTTLYEALDYVAIDKKAYEVEAKRLKRYSYIGEQINRLGSILRLIQEVPGNEAAYQRKLNEINFALGQDLETFLKPENLEAARALSIQDDAKFKADVQNQLAYVYNNYFNKKELSRFTEHEAEIRTFLNIKGIVANDPFLVAQLQAINSFNQIRKLLFFGDKHSEIRNKVLQVVGKKRLTYDEEFNDLAHAYDRMIIGSYFSNTNHVIDLSYVLPEGTNNKAIEHWSFNLSDSKSAQDFVNRMPEYVRFLKGKYPENSFVKGIDIESISGKPIHILKFRNSIHMSPSEKQFIKQDFRKLSEIDPTAADAIRFYQALVYGFSFRNGSFSDIIDTKFEEMFSNEMPNIETNILDNFYRSPNIVAVELALVADSLIQRNSFLREVDLPLYMRSSGMYGRPSYYMKSSIVPSQDARYTDQKGGVLVNLLYPKEMFIYKHGEAITHDFVYDQLSAAQLQELAETGRTTRTVASWVGVANNDYGATKNSEGDIPPYRNIPFNNSLARTIFNDLVLVKQKNNNSATFIKVDSQGKPLMSRISFENSKISERAIDALVQAIKKSFVGVDFVYVDGETTLNQDAIGYFFGGDVHINTDKVQTDTLFHELSHPMLHLIKRVHPGLYATLTTEAQMMLDNGDPLAMKVKNAYRELTDYDLLDEIVATAVGFNSIQAVERFMAAQNDLNYKNHSRGIWERVKAWISRFWAAIKSFFKGYALSVDPNTTTIADFSNQIVQKALKGENVLNISASKMKDILAAAYSTPNFQLAEPARTLDDVKDLFTDVSTFFKDGKETPIPHYKRMDLDERVAHFKMLLPSMNYKYYVNGVTYNFDEKTEGHIPKSQWDKVIRDEIMVVQDEKNIKMKKTVLAWLNGDEHKIDDLVAALGVNNLGDFIYTYDAIKEFLRGIHFTPTTKYYQYSEMWKNEELRPYYSEELIGFDPIVAVEYNHDDQMLVSFFNLTTQMLRVSELTTPLERKNILSRYLSDPAAKRRGLSDLTNKPGDVSNFLMGVAASKFVNAEGKKIHIGTIATVNLQPERAFFETADSVILTSNAKAMMDIEPFVKDLSPGMAKAIENFSLIKNGFSFERLIAKKYMDEQLEIPGLEDFYNGTMDVNDKKRLLTNRLKDLNSKSLSNLSNAAIQEIRMIVDALNVLEEGMIMSEQINSKKDFSMFENMLAPQFDANHPAIDLVRRTVLNTSMKIVEEMKEFKKRIDPFAQHFLETYEENNPAFTKYIYDVGPKYFERIIAHVVDDKGVKRNAGFVLWTTDPSLDPMFAEQAKQLSAKDLQMGKLFVDIVTDILTENMYHRRVSKYGEQYYDPDLRTRRTYTKADARKDLLTKTTYRPGMIPLMPDTVAGMASKGNLIGAFVKRRKQIESSYVMFDEMAQMSEQEANFIDSMPDQFMQQFLYNSSGDIVGSLGLQGKRMRNLLGLTEVVKPDGKIEYTYDKEADRAMGLNTDLEIVLEFLNMTTLRKINYENDVLPLINGVKTYLLDTNINQQFKQTNVLKYLEMYTRQSIEGKRAKLDLSLAGFNVDSTVQLAMAYASPLVMTLNVNVGIVSATHNFMMAFIEGIANSITDSHWAGVGEIMKASALYFSDWHKVSQLSHQYQIVNPNEYEIITHRYNQKRKKYLFSDYTANWTNWATDAYARGVIMTAQMLKDGSYYAHSYNEASGRTTYDPKKDKRFEIYFKGNEAHPEYQKQKVLYEGLKKRLLADGIPLVDGEAAQAYSLKEVRTFKTLADKYVVGAYGPMEKNLMSNFLIGRAFMMFTTWLMTKISNAFRRGSYIDELGYFDVIKDEEGNLVPQWMREWSEGYVTTVFNIGRRLIFDGDTKQFSNMKNAEKKNLIRFATTIAMFMFFKLLYAMMVDDDEKKRKGLMKYVPNIGLLPDWRMTRNIAYATSSLLVFPTLLEKAENPFAVMGILRRAFAKGLFGREIKLDNLRYLIPTYGGFHTLFEPYRYYRDR